MHKPAITQTTIHDVLANRWSPRAYDANKPVSQTQIIGLLEAARWAPSCFGDQPWRFVVCDKTTNPDAWKKALDCLVPGNQTWAQHAPVLLLICANTLFGHNQKPNRWAPYDTGAATENLCLQATALGLAAHQMGGFDVAKAQTAFAVPEQFTLMSMVTIGYAGSADSLPEDLRERELAPRERRPLGELFFNGAWDKAIL
jgi:nitroreductase